MKKASIFCLAVASNLLTTAPTYAYPGKTPSCAKAKYDIVKAIVGDGGWFSEASGPNKDPNNPFKGSYSIWFALTPSRGKIRGSGFTEANRRAASRFLQRSDLRAFATNLIKGCPSVSNVAFGISNSDYWVQFYKFPGGEVRPHVCLPAPGRNGWGYSYCP